ncbi:MAG: hypothetical protein ABW166_12590 [Sedimenticola sp.]
MKSVDEACRLFAWVSFVLGVVTGLVLGLWSFDGPFPTPDFLGDYDSLSRRMTRLGHIAYFGLGFLTLLLSWELSKLILDAREKMLAARMMILGNMFLPLTLFAASIYHPLKYLMPIPALCVLVAMSIAARGAYRRYAEL